MATTIPHPVHLARGWYMAVAGVALVGALLAVGATRLHARHARHPALPALVAPASSTAPWTEQGFRDDDDEEDLCLTPGCVG